MYLIVQSIKKVLKENFTNEIQLIIKVTIQQIFNNKKHNKILHKIYLYNLNNI